ncbi:MAG TPA: Si-specific NAD(P)(+) transhydrogenase [Acidobacteriota bacterium]|nr:Si-specific NAD(P)(+) transhydrogenase [bacterium]HNX19966.1 Si-specific NAD(P)(+) transhydrogenase [Acidobacteriota bacterium]
MDSFDLVVIGGGPAGERGAILAARAGKSVALVEQEHVVGGTRVNWGTIPSKTLRESALFVRGLTRNKLEGVRVALAGDLTVGDFMYRERRVVQRELDLINAALARHAVKVVRGRARFLDPRTIAVERGGERTATLRAEYVLVATGAAPHHPRDVSFDMETVFDSSSILWMPRLPRSLVVLGAGVIGIEYAAIFAALGLETTLIDTRERLLPYLDREIVGFLERSLVEDLGIAVVHDDHYRQIERLDGDPPRVRCATRAGRTFEAEALLYAAGRDGASRGIGLEEIGVVPDERGLIKVDENYRTAVPHVYAAGDVIGYPALASTSMEQGRRAVRHAFGIEGPRARTEQLPFAVYAIPEVSYVGETEDALKERGAPYVVGRARYDRNPRAQIAGATDGLLKLVFDGETMALRGVHIVGHGASELVHVGQAFLAAGLDAAAIAETLFNYPTLSDLYRHAALVALGARHPT